MKFSTIYDPIFDGVSDERREHAQSELGRHLVEHRNKVASLVRKWIETDKSYPIPIYERMIDRLRKLDPSTRADISSISLLMADQIVSSILATFDCGDEARTDEMVVNYAIIAQIRHPNSDEIVDQIDINRGAPVIALWDRYKKWLSQHAPSEVRPMAGPRRPR